MTMTTDPVADLAAWLKTQTWSDFAQSLAGQYESKGSLSEKQIASGMKMRATMAAKAEAKKIAAMAEAAKPAAEKATEAGMYKVGETIFKVQKAVHGSGHLYAKRLLPPKFHGAKARFVHAPGVFKTLTVADKMTLEEAKTFGALYGTCVVCGRTLTDEKSIAANIGPVCAKTFA